MNNPDELGQHIWLRYATQYTKDGRQHTLEMGIPVPLGADNETREALIREAEAGMQQLINHVEQRLPQMVQRPQGTVPTPVQATKTAPQQRVNPISNKPASVSAPQTTTQVVSTQDGLAAAGSATTAPQTRQSGGVGMPLAFSPTNTNSGNMLLPEFIQYIKENLDLNPKQAMDILKVKTLSGINLREAVEHLKRTVGTTGESIERDELADSRDNGPTAPNRSVSYTIPPAKTETKITRIVTGSNDRDKNDEAVHEHSSDYAIPTSIPTPTPNPTRGFDEEVEPDDQLDDLIDLEPDPEFTPQELERANNKISYLRELQGNTNASENRLKALGNVVTSQITLDQLQTLVRGIWNVTTMKKLKIDQVEALISWGKEDDFLSEVEAVLAVLEEENYARGNR
ncbi:hypothetical protein [Tengunoibacter tsumagoiensis]|uniref:Uncharacterized protein n=1 Tax=Tengunoibacter tsumagoiensis TaxID=2014871 RepID=A0A401ZTQ4_9CHLR|nr:hypothetical protein [Tengunoibacter tsumagoiensis]GCE10279.1 hypothetical protein KTT_01380 [Tengunoibacter tsumagoiensis]